MSCHYNSNWKDRKTNCGTLQVIVIAAIITQTNGIIEREIRYALKHSFVCADIGRYTNILSWQGKMAPSVISIFWINSGMDP